MDQHQIAIVDSDALDELRRELDSILIQLGEGRLYHVRFCIEDGIKIKCNESTWSPPIGRYEFPRS